MKSFSFQSSLGRSARKFRYRSCIQLFYNDLSRLILSMKALSLLYKNNIFLFMKQRRVINSSFLLGLSVWIASSFFVYPALGDVVIEMPQAEVMEEAEMLWSSRVQKILEEEQHKFSEVDNFYYFRYAWSDIFIAFFVHSLVIMAIYIGFIHDMLVTFLPRNVLIIRGVIALGSMILVLEKVRYVYSFRSERGYFFLTDKGLLIIDPGYTEKCVWLLYDDIQAVEVLSYPKNIIEQRYLRIVDRGGREREFPSDLLPSRFVFQDLYSRLMEKVEHAKKIKEKKHKAKKGPRLSVNKREKERKQRR